MNKSILRIKIASIFSLLFVIFLIGCVSATVATNHTTTSTPSESILDKILRTKTLRVGTTGDFSPFTYQLDTESNAFYGVDVELAKDLAKSLDVDIKFVKTTWPTLMKDLASNKFDIGMSGITVKLTRQQQALFSVPLLSSGKAAITRDENVEKYKSIADINKKGVRVIVNPGGTNEAFALANFPNATLVHNDDNLSVFQKIVDGEVDLMVTDAVETLVQELIHPELEAVNPNEPFNFFEMGYLLPRDHTFKAYIDQWIHLRKKDGTYQKIFDTELEEIKVRASQN